jgi:hypothetical protein
VRVVLLSPRAVQPGLGRDTSRVEVIPADEDWLGQILDIVRKAGCRWVVLPSYIDQYLPGAFEAVLSAPVKAGQSVVGPCYIRVDGQRQLVSPHPFRFDYYALLFQTNYIAPAAVFLDAGAFVTTGGLDARFPTAGVWEYLLHVGAGGGVVALNHPIVETEAKPFLGVPREHAGRYAVEAAAIAFQYNNAGFTPGTMLGLAAVMGEHLDGLPTFAGYDSPLLRLGGKLKRDVERALRSSLPRPDGKADEDSLSGERYRPFDFRGPWWDVVIPLVKRVAPIPVWKFLKRCRNAWVAFRLPVL